MQRLCLATAACLFALLVPAAARADDEAQLRKQIAELKAENSALKDTVIKLKKELADEKAKAKAADDAKLLQGGWNVVALENDRRKAPAEALKGMSWTFAESEVRFADPGQEAGAKASVKLDPSKSPKQIDMVGLDGPMKGKPIHGIYKFEKDRLVVCLGDVEAGKKGRPEGFSVEKGSGRGMITLERAKDEPPAKKAAPAEEKKVQPVQAVKAPAGPRVELALLELSVLKEELGVSKGKKLEGDALAKLVARVEAAEALLKPPYNVSTPGDGKKPEEGKKR